MVWLRYLFASQEEKERIIRGKRVFMHMKKRLALIRKRNVRATTPLIVYHMGKVGSTSVINSIRKNTKNPFNPDQTIHLDIPYHVHFMSRSGIFKKTAPRKDDYYILPNLHLQVGWALHEFFIKSGEKMHFIVPVRDVISRNLSSFFQIMDGNHHFLHKWMSGNIENYHKDEVIEIAIKYIFDISSYPKKWFENEIEKVLNLKVFEYPFNSNKGYQVIENNIYKILIFKIELDNEIIGQAIGDFIQKKSFKLSDFNISSNKRYGELYKYVKKNIRINQDILDQCYSSLYMKHFYTSSEIDHFRKMWGGR